MSWLGFGKKGEKGQQSRKSEGKKKRYPRKTFILEEIITPSVMFPVLSHDSNPLQHLLDSLPHLHLGLMADGGACPVAPPTDGDLPPLIQFDPLGLMDAPTPTPGTDIKGLFETLPKGVVVPIDPPGNTPKAGDVDPSQFALTAQPLIGIIDTGFSGNNSDLDRSRVTLGRDRVSNDDNPLLSAGEGNEHGTFIEGIIGASRNNGVGIDGINDKAPMWVGRAIGSGKWAESLREFVDAVKKSGQPNGLVNLSLDLTQQNPDGSVTTRYEFTPEERSALEYARQNHVLIVAAAGNEGGVMSVLGQASQEFDNIFTVGAADGKNRAAYSSYGRGLDILAAGGTPEKPEWSTVGDGVGTMAGTSVATAKVTGAASLVWAANPELNYRQVIEILKSTAKDLSAPGWDQETGAGLLDIEAAVAKAKVTTPEVYNPEDFLTLTTGIRGGQVTPQERAVQVHQVQNPWGRRYYYGWLNNSNRMDRFDFTVTSTKLVQLSLKDAFNNDFLEAQVSLYDGNGNYYPLNQPDFNSSYRSVTLYPGNYHLHVDKGYRDEIDPYKLSLNFNQNNDISVLDESIWLPRPVISQPPVFTPPPSQPSVPIVIQPPPVDWQKIAEEQAKAELLKQQQAEAAAKAAAEASAKAAAEAAAKAAAEAEQRRRSEAEENARKAIALAYEKNQSWLGNSFNDVQIDWNTLLNSRVAAIQYFNGGYVVWNGVHAVAYQTGSRNSSTTNVTPIEVRLHDLGMQYGRKEYGQYVGFANRQDYYRFTVEKIGDEYPQDLLFALRSSGVDIPLTDATIEILDAQFNPVSLSKVWQPNGQPGSSNLTGTTYYVRVKPAKNNLNYGLTLNLDSAQESLGSARPLGAIKGRQQFRDFVGNKGDGLGDYYSFSVEHPSLLQYSLSQFDPGGDANVEILDSNGNVLPPDQFSGKVGGKELQPGQYYLRVTAANNTNTNYTLTMQMAEELGTYTGRHEYNDRVMAGKYREAFYRLKVDAPAEDLHLALKNLSGDANVELLRNDGSGIVNSTLISPVVGSNQSGTQAEYKAYANVPPGDYLVRVYMPDSSVPWTKYDLVMNLDQAGEDWSRARNLGMLTDIAQLSDYQFSDFVGADKGDGSDVYKFQVGDYGLVHLALKPPVGDAGTNMLAGNMRLQDESGKDVDLLNITTRNDFNYAAAYLEPGKSYYLTVSSNPGMVTNYNLVINPVSEETINGFRVSGDLYKVFAQYRESLGSPTSAVTNESSGVSYQAFQNGLIVASSYGSYPVWWGIKDAYLNKYGSLSGKLGAPTGMEYDWNGGKRQDFAGGYITWENGFTQAYKNDGSLLYPPPPNFPVGGIDLAGLQKLLYGNVPTTITASWGQKDCSLWGANHPDCKHPGIDIAATGDYLKKNPPLYSPVDGVVTAVDPKHGLVYLYNEKTNTTFRFLHMNSWNVSQGNRVSKGQQIGTEGHRGYATGDHLHIDAWPGKHNSRYPDYSDTTNPVDAVNLANHYNVTYNNSGSLIVPESSSGGGNVTYSYNDPLVIDPLPGEVKEPSLSFNEFISKVKNIESDIDKWSLLWKTRFPLAINERGYVTANVLRRKSQEKYRGFEWEISSGWTFAALDSANANLTYAWGESLPEFSTISDGKTAQTVSLGENITIPIGHFFAALAYQFGHLGPFTQNTHGSYGGDIGSFLQVAGSPNSEEDISDRKYLNKVMEQKFPDDQKDADIAAHVIAWIVGSKNINVSKALEIFRDMSQKEKYQKFVELEFGSLDQAKDKLITTVTAYLNDKVMLDRLNSAKNKPKETVIAVIADLNDQQSTRGDVWSTFNVSSEEIHQAFDYIAQNFIDYIKQKIGLG